MLRPKEELTERTDARNTRKVFGSPSCLYLVPLAESAGVRRDKKVVEE